MDKQPPNVILFDEDDPPPTPTSTSRPPSSQIVHDQIASLTAKLKQLEAQAQQLQLTSNDSHINPRPQVNQSHWQQLLLLIEKKIQIVVRETKKIVDRLSEGFDRKMEQKLKGKYEESGMGQVKQNYAHAIKRIQQHYQAQLQKATRHFREAQQKMLTRVTALQQQLNTRMNNFTIKQKEYVDWIHHLQVQLQQKPKRKMIEVTQERVGKSNTPGKGRPSEHGSFISVDNGHNNTHVQPLRSVSPQENSKITRKRKIFDGHSRTSVSPNNKVVSGHSETESLQSQPYFASTASNSSKVVNPLKSRPVEQTAPLPMPSPHLHAEPTISLTTKATQPLRTQLPNNQNDSSPWRVMESMEKSGMEGTRRHNLVKQASEDEFYKDVPKANQGWEGFQDFKENEESSGSSDEEGVMFYREGDGKERFLDRGARPEEAAGGEQKVFSPFDL